MKLYATIASERASKSQGGNKQIEITLLIDPIERKEVGRLIMKYENDTYRIEYYPINSNCIDQKLNSGRLMLYQEKSKKGEKQKTLK